MTGPVDRGRPVFALLPCKSDAFLYSRSSGPYGSEEYKRACCTLCSAGGNTPSGRGAPRQSTSRSVASRQPQRSTLWCRPVTATGAARATCGPTSPPPVSEAALQSIELPHATVIMGLKVYKHIGDMGEESEGNAPWPWRGTSRGRAGSG